jgi:predicted NBD/HSP70 family sugar kinase
MHRDKVVFLSHSNTDSAVAERICHALEAANVGCWIAPRDVPAGKQYPEVITDAITLSRVLLLVFSHRVLDSPTVFREVEMCSSRGIPIVVYRLDSTDPRQTKFALFLRSYQWFDDGMNGNVEGTLPRLVNDVMKLLGHEPAAEVPPRSEDVGRSDGRSSRRSREGEKAMSPGQRVIGIDVGSTNVRGCIRELTRPEVRSPREKAYVEDIRRPTSPRSVLEQTKGMIARIFETEHFGRQQPAGIGIAVPGQTDVRAGTLKFSPGLAVRNVPFRTALAKAYPGLKIRIDNDARCATRCELHLGTGREYNSFVCIFVGTGVGSGVVLNRRIHFGDNFCAGEIGHMKIDVSGPLCTCGQVGCLEAFVNGPAIAARARAKSIDWHSRGLTTRLTEGEALDAKAVARALEEGDHAAREAVEEVGEKLGLGIANYLNLINPGAVVLGGGVMTGFFLHMVESITRGLQKNAIAELANTPIIQSQFTDDGAAIGAALLFHPDEPWPA